MHRALKIPEVVDLILQAADTRALPVCAVVCRAWELPALRILWRAPTNLKDLFYLLGHSYVTGISIHRESNQVVNPEKWERFHRHCKLLRQLYISIGSYYDTFYHHDPPTPTVTSLMFQDVAVMAASAGQSLFPSLTSLNLWLLSKESAMSAGVLLSSPLSCLKLTWISESQSGLPWFASRLRAQAVFIKTLDLNYVGFHTISELDTRVLLKDTLSSLQNLVKLHVPLFLAAYLPAWNVVANLPNLEWFGFRSCLETFLENSHEWNDLYRLNFNQGFRSLIHFVGEGPPELAFSLLEDSSPISTIRTLQFLTEDHMTDPEELPLLLETIATFAPHLECLALSVDTAEEINVRDFKPLERLQNLHGLWFRSQGSLFWTDEEYQSFARTMPQLTRLYLAMDPTEYDPIRGKSTLLALLYIVSACPNMEEIGVFVYAPVLAAPNGDIVVKPLPPELVINFGYSPIEDPLATALTLYRMCGRNRIFIEASSRYPFPRANIEARREIERDTKVVDSLALWNTVKTTLERVQPLVADLFRPLVLPLQELNASAENEAPLDKNSGSIKGLLSVVRDPGVVGSLL
ncbi:hypothetical protein DL93DRAFT_2170528 [Clavulina sp. PMI_390]|nr:hypothetical protein DL93DRAFT_2170528 [Clavulina sp. PMI_390]